MNSPEKNETGKNGSGRRRLLLIIAGVFALIGTAWFLAWLLVFSKREVTDDAYVAGNQVQVSAQVSGTVVAVMADDTQRVEAGQVLVRLDPVDAQLALARSRSALAQAVRQVRQQRETSNQFESTIAARKQDLARAEADLARREPLLAEHAVAAEEVAHAREAVVTAKSALETAQRQAAGARALVDGVDVAENPSVQAAKAAFREAWIAAERNEVVAPIAGYVAQRSVQVGTRVAPGQALLTIVPLRDLWIDANFKEIQLEHLRIGQEATIHADIYGDVVFHGHVTGLGAGTGGAFALLPPQNASGNWIKVVQRVPVRVTLDPRELDAHPLRLGLSATVKVAITDLSGPMLAQAPAKAAVAETDVYTRDLAHADKEADAVVAQNLSRD